MIGNGKVETPSMRWFAQFMVNVTPAARAQNRPMTSRSGWVANVVFVRDNEAEVVAVDLDDGAVTDLVLAIADGTLRDVNDIAGRLAPMVIEGSEAVRS